MEHREKEETSDSSWDNSGQEEGEDVEQHQEEGPPWPVTWGTNRRVRLPPGPASRNLCVFAQAGPLLSFMAPLQTCVSVHSIHTHTHTSATAQPRDLQQVSAQVLSPLENSGQHPAPNSVLVIPASCPQTPSPTFFPALMRRCCDYLQHRRSSHRTELCRAAPSMVLQPWTVLSEQVSAD